MGSSESSSKTNNEDKENVILLGDSVLDNFYWLDNKKEDLCFQLNDIFTRDFKGKFNCINLALDETESPDIYNGKKPSPVYVKDRELIGMDNYKVDNDGFYYPLKLVAKTNAKYCVLSVGGNDARVLILKHLGNVKKVYQEMTESFITNYTKAVDSVMKLIPNVILVLVYRPGPGFLLNLEQCNQLFNLLIPGLLAVARQKKLPVIDLSRTFNPENKSHYGTTPIEPSNKSSMFIANLIIKVLGDFKFGEDTSKIYYGSEKDKIIIDKNSEDYLYKLS